MRRIKKISVPITLYKCHTLSETQYIPFSYTRVRLIPVTAKLEAMKFIEH